MMHFWGDEGVDWKGIAGAAEYIGERCRRLGRINVTQYKEKYGTVRVYCSFGYYSLHELIWPGYAYKRDYWPHFMWTLDIYFWPNAFKYSGLGYLLHKWQKFIYRSSYKRALKKWPHLRKEILCCADFSEFLKGL